MTRTIVIDLAGEEDVLVTRRKKEDAGPGRQLYAPAAEGLTELITYDELHETMPQAYRELFEEYFRK